MFVRCERVGDGGDLVVLESVECILYKTLLPECFDIQTNWCPHTSFSTSVHWVFWTWDFSGWRCCCSHRFNLSNFSPLRHNQLNKCPLDIYSRLFIERQRHFSREDQRKIMKIVHLRCSSQLDKVLFSKSKRNCLIMNWKIG